MKQGFTLLEVIVVMAIIATLVGIMVPFVYRIWESSDIEVTKERMLDLKRAMVGDARMVQNGIRTHFGYIGKNAQLPASLDAARDYLAPGYDPNAFKLDAWGRPLVYAASALYEDGAADPLGRRIRATLQSAGPNGITGDADDISAISNPDLQISSAEVAPAERITGNIHVLIHNSVAVTYDPVPDPADPSKTIGWTPVCAGETIPDNYFFARVYLDWVPFGPYSADAQSDCVPLNNIGQVYCRTSKEYSRSFGNTIRNALNPPEAVTLPAGQVVFWAALYSNSACTSEIAGSRTEEKTVFINEGQSVLSLNLSFQTVYP